MIERSCFFHLHPSPSSSSSSSTTSSDSSFSSDNCYITATRSTPPVVLRELLVRDLDDSSLTEFHCQRRIHREPFRIPRPILTIPRPIIHVPTSSSLWTPSVRPTRIELTSRSLSPSSITRHTERPLYQNLPLTLPPLPPPPPPARIPFIPTVYQIGSPPPFQQSIPLSIARPIKKAKFVREKPPGLFTTLSAGGFSTLAVLIYLIFLLGLPITKLVLGILYVQECPINKNIPIYMIVSGACGLAMIIFLLLTSACTYCRAICIAKKSTHGFMICTIALGRGMQGALAIFLFIWFFIGNGWVFGVRYRVQTDRPNNTTNYCNPTLYWFAFYVLIFTYVYAIFTFCFKFFFNFCCCGACDIWHKAFS